MGAGVEHVLVAYLVRGVDLPIQRRSRGLGKACRATPCRLRPSGSAGAWYACRQRMTRPIAEHPPTLTATRPSR
eukprot:9339157-Prorocentrum_lima.AAC.1